MAACKNAGVLPAELATLFWEIDPGALDLRKHRDYVLERVMTRGGLRAMRWLRATYGNDEIAEFLQRRGDRLAPRERAFWSLVVGRPQAAGRGGGRPSWAG